MPQPKLNINVRVGETLALGFVGADDEMVYTLPWKHVVVPPDGRVRLELAAMAPIEGPEISFPEGVWMGLFRGDELLVKSHAYTRPLVLEPGIRFIAEWVFKRG